MRVCTLQFAPQPGEIESNTSRASCLIADLQPGSLDLLVLPELALTGYNFPSLNAIKPCLEPTAAGRSARWAVTTASRLACTVVIGYPETTTNPSVIPTTVRPERPEDTAQKASGDDITATSAHKTYNFNSTLAVDPSGRVLAHYRKSYLYYTDATWALPSPTGFLTTPLPLPLPLPSSSPTSPPPASPSPPPAQSTPTTFAICMDFNPHAFTAPWSAYELAHHALSTNASVLLAGMAWLTFKERAELDALPAEPDWSSLSHWVERLRPLSEADGETLVVVANRVGVEEGGTRVCDLERVGWESVWGAGGGGHGTEEGGEQRKVKVEDVPGAEPVVGDEDGVVAGEARYAGTSVVMALGRGRTRVWGILGRAEEGVLRVDTAEEPESVLVLRKESDALDDDGHSDSQ